jgi:hypothetical protein
LCFQLLKLSRSRSICWNKIALSPLPTVGTNRFRRLFCRSGGRNTARRERHGNSAARSVGRLFFCGSRLQNLAPFQRKKVCSFDSRGLKWQSIQTSHSRFIPFFRIGTYLVRQAVAIDSVWPLLIAT